MRKLLKHLKIYIFRGILAIIPIVLTILVIRLLYVSIDRRVMGWFDQFIGFSIPGLGILFVIIILYVKG